MTLEFLLTSLVVIATPGTGVLYTLGAGLARGTRAAVVATVGCTLGTVPHALLALTGLAALLQAGGTAFRALTWAGAAYLLYMAWATLRDRGSLAITPGDAAPRSTRRVIASAVLMNLLNPKLTIFFLAFLPQFVDPSAPGAVPRMALLGAVFTLLTFLVFACYGTAAAVLRDRVLSRPSLLAWIRRVLAGAFAALGVRLALAGV
jgi:threonine/homoserine/homoserine lactone efflux protein